jgi:WD40 repeat protein/uncharacterized caspase-like protein
MSHDKSALKTGQAKLWILLISVNHYYDRRFPSLQYSEADCQGLADALSEATQFFPETTIAVHHDSAALPPTLGSVRSSLQAITELAKPQDTVLIYFCGHSALESRFQQAVLCLADTERESLLKTGLSIMSLLGVLGNCAAKQQVLWIDTCHGNGIQFQTETESQNASRLLDYPSWQLIDTLRQQVAQNPGLDALVSCDRSQQSWKFPDLGHGVFTYFLIEGLRGKAADNQGLIKTAELAHYIQHQTQRYLDQTNQQLQRLNLQDGEEAAGQAKYFVQTPKQIGKGGESFLLGIKPHDPLERVTPRPEQPLRDQDSHRVSEQSSSSQVSQIETLGAILPLIDQESPTQDTETPSELIEPIESVRVDESFVQSSVEPAQIEELEPPALEHEPEIQSTDQCAPDQDHIERIEPTIDSPTQEYIDPTVSESESIIEQVAQDQAETVEPAGEPILYEYAETITSDTASEIDSVSFEQFGSIPHEESESIAPEVEPEIEATSQEQLETIESAIEPVFELTETSTPETELDIAPDVQAPVETIESTIEPVSPEETEPEIEATSQEQSETIEPTIEPVSHEEADITQLEPELDIESDVQEQLETTESTIEPILSEETGITQLEPEPEIEATVQPETIEPTIESSHELTETAAPEAELDIEPTVSEQPETIEPTIEPVFHESTEISDPETEPTVPEQTETIESTIEPATHELTEISAPEGELALDPTTPEEPDTKEIPEEATRITESILTLTSKSELKPTLKQPDIVAPAPVDGPQIDPILPLKAPRSRKIPAIPQLRWKSDLLKRSAKKAQPSAQLNKSNIQFEESTPDTSEHLSRQIVQSVTDQSQSPKTRKFIATTIGGVSLAVCGLTGATLYQQRNSQILNLQTLILSSETQLSSNQASQGLITALKAGDKLQSLNQPWNLISDDEKISTSATLQQAIIQSSGQFSATLENGFTNATISPDQKTFAVTGADRTIQLWQREGNQLQHLNIKFVGHQGTITQLRFSHDGKLLASASEDKTIKIWDIEKGTLIKTLTGHTDRVTAVEFRSDNGVIASGSADQTIRLWSVANGNLLDTLKGNDAEATVIRFSPDGRILATGSVDDAIRVWYPDSNKPILLGRHESTLDPNKRRITDLAFTPDGKTIASASWDKSIKLWAIDDAKSDQVASPKATLTSHASAVTSLSFSPTGSFLASGSQDQTIKLWNIQSKTLIKTLPGHQSSITSLAFSFTGNTLISASDRHGLIQWSLDLPLLMKQACDLLPEEPKNPEVNEICGR